MTTGVQQGNGTHPQAAGLRQPRRRWWPTVGRFWGYVGILIGLCASLAANEQSAYIDDKHPSHVIITIGALPPLALFVIIEILTHNPFHLVGWGQRGQQVIGGLVGVPSAIISYTHLASLIVHGHTGDPIMWMVALLTPLMIDGLLAGSTAALLLPTGAADPKPLDAWDGSITSLPIAWLSTPIQSAAIGQAAADDLPDLPDVPQIPDRPKPKAIGGRKRPGAVEQHPSWATFSADHAANRPWTAGQLQAALQEAGETLSPDAARSRLRRWVEKLPVES